MTAKRHLDTLAIHAGQSPDPTTGAVMTQFIKRRLMPRIIPEPTLGVMLEPSNPTRSALQECIAALEQGHHGTAFSSGVTSLMLLYVFYRQARFGRLWG